MPTNRPMTWPTNRGLCRGRRNSSLARIALAAAAVLVTGLGAAATGVLADEEPKRFSCTFNAGKFSSYDGGTFREEGATPLSFDLDDIDLKGQSAKIIASAGAEPGNVRVVRALNANHFLEVATEGFLNLTTVYDRDTATGVHPAIHSRHFGLLGKPVYGHYTGSCRAR